MDFKVRADMVCSLSASFSERGACWCQRWAGPGAQVTHAHLFLWSRQSCLATWAGVGGLWIPSLVDWSAVSQAEW